MAGARAMGFPARWVVCCLLLAEAAAQNRARDRVQQSGGPTQQGGARPAGRSWNTQLYPKWQGGADQRRDCWKGGDVSFAATNDGPTLVAAKTTFSVQINFPHNQTVLPDGQVVWSQNCTVNGTRVVSGEPVYPDAPSPGSDCVFPDGQRFPPGAQRRRSKFVYVWQTLGKYWQVMDGPSSHLAIDTEGVALGSYTMEVVVYHYRGRQQFIPMGRTTSQFTVTDQVPFSVSISQILDLDEADSRFVQNRALAFTVRVHDPSQYLQDADIAYSWDFGDQSGTLLTHGTTVTHTYLSTGSFRPQVVLQAAIPLPACASTPAGTMGVGTTGAPEDPTAGGTTSPAAVTPAASTLAPETAAPDGTNAPDPAAPTSPASAAPAGTVASSGAPAAETPAPATLPADVNLEVESAAPETAQPPVVATEDIDLPLETSVAPVEEAEMEVPAPAEGTPAVAEVALAEGTPAVAEVAPAEGTPAVAEVALAEGTPAVAEVAPAVTVLSESLEVAAAGTTRLPESTTELEETAAPEVEATPGAALPETAAAVDESLVLVKRQAIENQPNDCLLYRYGSYATDLDIVEGIESVEIVQMVPALSVSGAENAVDFTVTCQGSIPSDVCTTVSDPDCLFPVQTVCSPVPPSSDCQMVLRQLFNSSGDYCVNVSLTNAVSLAVASAQVHVSGGSSATAGFGIFVGILVVGLVLAGVAYTYRHVKRYSPLSDAPAVERSSRWIPDRASLHLFFRNALGHTLSGESSPLLSGHVV